MPKTVNTRLYDNAVRHQIGILRYSTGVTKDLVGAFNRHAVPMILSIINSHDPIDQPGLINQHRVDAMLASIDASVDAAFKPISEDLDAAIKDLGSHEVDHNVEAIKRAIPIPVRDGIKAARKPKPKLVKPKFDPSIGLVLGIPTPDQVYAAVHARPFQGKLLAEQYAGLTDTVKQQVRTTIRQGYVNGQTTDQIVRTLRGSRSAKFTDGILQQSRRSIERLTRTALNHTANVARDQVYQTNSDVMDGVRWVSTLDTKTSDICIALDGQVFPVDSGPRPPAHLNCRSCTSPVVKSWRDLGFDIDELPEATRASMDGQVPASETYGTWLGRQDEATQNDDLGPTRAALFRDGDLTVDKFVDDAGQSLTLDQLRAREASAFEKADL